MRPRRPAILLALGLALAMPLGLAAGAAAARADEVPAAASDAEAREAIRTFTKAWKDKDPETRLAAVQALGEVRHPDVAERLLKTAARCDEVEILTALYRALARQTAADDKVVRKLGDALFDEAEEAQKRMRKGELGFRVEPRTGEADVDSEEGKRILAETEARGRRLAAMLEAYVALAKTPPKDPEDLAIFLQDPLDALVLTTLDAFARWEVQDVLAHLLELYRMYPDPYRWETGAVHHAGGTDASARAEWMARFGHPQKQRHRPEVVEALQKTLERLTGEEQATPEDLEAWMKARGKSTTVR